MTKNIPPLTAERLRELLDYDQMTGVFTWRPRTAADFTAGALHDAAWLCNVWNALRDARPDTKTARDT
jgi:hypothetical protein